ncbi:MAG TPA: glutamate synthase-related protein, partial [Trueperaceae bacterium]
MSFGSLSAEAHETLAIAMNRIGGRSGSGEGGEDPRRYGTERNSAVKQIASGRFGVTPAYLASAAELQIKIAQGSKPGEGGQVPGSKVTEYIARLRHTVPGVALISPPPHHDIYSIEDLAQLIYDLKRVNPEARVAVKLVASTGVGTVASGVAKGYADTVQVSGHDGGTGASPLSSVKHSGLPWELGLIDVQRSLVANDLRGRVRLRVDGGLKSARDVVVAAALGAEEFGFGTTALVALGCAMIRQCHLNTCPVGIATQDPELRKRFAGEPDHVVRFFTFLAESLRHELARLGLRSLDELVGRWDLVRVREGAETPKGVSLDLRPLVDPGALPPGSATRWQGRRNDPPPPAAPTLDDELAAAVAAWLERGAEGVLEFDAEVDNGQRTLGARAAGLVARRYGDAGPRDGSLVATFTGAAGQSFGSFALPGMRLVLRGEAQDYVGKSLAGGELVLRPRRPGEAGVIAGNTVLYGATSGALFASGSVGERVCVRNSGAEAVVEGCGDHGCEYMTGGTVVVLGPVGRNFAAGMSGGEAFVLDDDGRFLGRLNDGSVAARRLTGDAAEARLRRLIERHASATGSTVAADLLADWPAARARFWHVLPRAAAGLGRPEPEGAGAAVRPEAA